MAFKNERARLAAIWRRENDPYLINKAKLQGSGRCANREGFAHLAHSSAIRPAFRLWLIRAPGKLLQFENGEVNIEASKWQVFKD